MIELSTENHERIIIKNRLLQTPFGQQFIKLCFTTRKVPLYAMQTYVLHLVKWHFINMIFESIFDR